jgi:hypothetical protein
MIVTAILLLLIGIVISVLLARVVAIPFSRIKSKQSEKKLYTISSIVITILALLFAGPALRQQAFEPGYTGALGIFFYTGYALGFVLVGLRYFKK